METVLDLSWRGYIILSCFPSDASLTVTNVLATVQDVEVLERIFQLSFYKKQELRKQSAGDEEWKEVIVKYFLHTNPNASWEWLGGKLLWMGEDETLQKVKVYIKYKEGESQE